MMDYKEFGQFFTKKGIPLTEKLSRDEKNKTLLVEKTFFLSSDVSLLERIYVYLNDIKEPVKCECGNLVKFIGKMKKGYSKHCSIKCSKNSEEVKEKFKKTCFEKYGVENPSQLKEVKEKKKKTCIENFGVEHASKLSFIQDKKKKTNIERYGVECVFQSEDVREKGRKTNLERYGVENPMQSSIIQEKVKQTNLERYGVEHPMQSEEVKEKGRKTCIENFGVEYTFQSEEAKEKIKQTLLENFGVENPSQLKEVKEKKKKTCFENFGVENPMQSEEVKEKKKKTCFENFGVESYSQMHNPEAFKLLENKEWLEKEYEVKSSVKISEELSVGHSVVCRYILKHGLKSDRWSNSISYQETEVLNFIKSIYDGELILNSREILNPKEIDIYLPEKNLAIEFNGMHWHSTKYKDKFYHLNKTLECESQGIQLLQIFENEWIEKQDIWKSVIRTKLGLIDTKIYGRKCVIKEVSNPEGKLFFENNHLQGGLNRGKHLGLYFEEQLVACISYGSSRFESNTTEIYRFASLLNTSVIGGFSKLMKQVPKPIVSYANRRWSNGNVYTKNGFEFVSETEPNYIYYKNSKVYSRQKFMKHKLEKLVGIGLLEFYDEEFTESEIMELNGFEKLYDCGNLKYML
jgi:hypothetical protein